MMLPTFQRSGRSLESDSSSQSIGVATGAPGRARTAYGGTAVCAYPLRAVSKRMRPPRLALRNSVVSSSGWLAASTRPMSRASARTSSKSARRRSGVHTWMPFEPVTCANGENPSSRISSPVWRAARRTAAKSPSGGGSRSITSRSGCQTRSRARAIRAA